MGRGKYSDCMIYVLKMLGPGWSMQSFSQHPAGCYVYQQVLICFEHARNVAILSYNSRKVGRAHSSSTEVI